MPARLIHGLNRFKPHTGLNLPTLQVTRAVPVLRPNTSCRGSKRPSPFGNRASKRPLLTRLFGNVEKKKMGEKLKSSWNTINKLIRYFFAQVEEGVDGWGHHRLSKVKCSKFPNGMTCYIFRIISVPIRATAKFKSTRKLLKRSFAKLSSDSPKINR